MIIEIDGIYYAYISLTQPPVLVVDYNPNDEMLCTIKCPYCGELTTIGETIMIHGFVGCSKCYWGDDGLRAVAEYYKQNRHIEYANGVFYRNGYRNWRAK